MISTTESEKKMKNNNIKLAKTKLVATCGPTFKTKEDMLRMFAEGVNVARLNMSHGSKESHLEVINNIKAAREELNIPVAILLDTKGPEIRTHEMEDNNVQYKIGETITIVTDEILGNSKSFSISYEEIDLIVSVGSEIYIDDGKLGLVVTDVKKGQITTTALNSHSVSSRRGVNIPGAKLTLPFISDYDKEMILFGLENDIDSVAASFVSTGEDIIELRKLLDDNGGSNVQIVPKIESALSLQNLNEIFKYSDGVMLARGDLAVEIPFQEVPYYQQLIIEKSRAFGIPIIIATQMLDSMTSNPKPTRAEAADVYYAVMNGTDATMLSGESASSKFPFAAVNIMRKLQEEAEKHFNYKASSDRAHAYVTSANSEIAFEIASKIAQERFDHVLVFSKAGHVLRALSMFRPASIVIGLIEDPAQRYKFSMHHSIFTEMIDEVSSFYDDAKLNKIITDLGIKGKILVANSKEMKELEI
ncbi:MAG: pyruvate kinase [Tenericutes bacterium]|nr:MAG: pyruvate kinase [Mycoplasmatota bacterium]